jgi:hypothetical protein
MGETIPRGHTLLIREVSDMRTIRAAAIGLSLSLGLVMTAAGAVVTVFSPVPQSALDGTNGRKCAVRATGLDCVFVDGAGMIRHTSTTNGTTWAVPAAVGPGSKPAIAAVGSTLGLIYSTPQGIAYRFKAGASPWSQATMFSSSQGEAAIAAFGSRMYATWLDGTGTIFFAEFPPNQLTPPPNVTVVKDVVTTTRWQDFISTPAIVVFAGSKPSQPPIVRVFWFERRETATLTQQYFGVAYADRPSVPPANNWKYQLIQSFGVGSIKGSMGVSLSAAAVHTGQVFVTASALRVTSPINKQEITRLYRQDAWTLAPWQIAPINQKLSHVTVAATVVGVNCPSTQIRIAVAELTASGFGPAWYKSGTWTGATPALSAPAVLSPASGRAPQALFWSVLTAPALGSNAWKEVHAFFVDGSSLKAVTVTSAGPSDCVPTNPPPN